MKQTQMKLRPVLPVFRRALPLLLSLLLLCGACGCSERSPSGTSSEAALKASADTQADTSLPVCPESTQADTSLPVCPESTQAGGESTAEPDTTAETQTAPAEDFPPLDREAAVLRYEQTPLAFQPVDRAWEAASSDFPAPRYRLDADGVWRSGGASDSPAVIMLTGDLMCQARQQNAAKRDSGYDFRASFDFVRPVFAEADLVIGNLEATLCEAAPYMAEQPSVEGRPHLNAPPAFLEAVRDAGFDLVVMSNNHNCDAGVRGGFDSLEHVEEYGLLHTGTFRDSREPRYLLIEVNGIRLGVMSYATYFNHKEAHFTEEGVRTLLNPYDPERAASDAAAAKAAGAEFLLVYIHWGTEYTNTPNEKQTRIARELADAGFDYVIGSHPHALQPYALVERSDGQKVPVLYSMGNFVSHQNKTVTKDSMILKLVLDREENGTVSLLAQGYVPCRVFQTILGRSYAVVPVTSPFHQGIRSQYFRPAYERITAVIGPELSALGDE